MCVCVCVYVCTYVRTYNFTGLRASRVIIVYCYSAVSYGWTIQNSTVAINSDYSWSLNSCEVITNAPQSNELSYERHSTQNTRIYVYIHILISSDLHKQIQAKTNDKRVRRLGLCLTYFLNRTFNLVSLDNGAKMSPNVGLFYR